MTSKNHVWLTEMLGVLVLVVSNFGCGGSSTAPHPTSVSVAAGTTTVQAGATAQVTATVTNDSANKGVAWTVSCSAASCGTVSPSATASGVATTYTAPTTPPSSNMTVTITATSVANNSASASATITVPAGITVSVAPSTATVQVGATSKFTATVTNDPANKGVTWTVSCSAASCGTVSPSATASGVATTYTAPTTPPTSTLTVTITATSVTNALASASATITVPVGITVSVAPSTATVQASATAKFTATVANDPTNKGVTWTVSCSAAACGAVLPTATASGVATTYTAPTTPPASNVTVTITATSAANTSASASATITLPTGIAVSVTPSTATVQGGATSKFTATVTNDPANKGVTWSVSCSATQCGSISPTSTASGAATTYTAPPPPANDLPVTLTATSVANSLAMTSATITVPAITVDTEPRSPTVLANTTQKFTATVGNDLSNGGVTWTVSCSPAPCGTVSPTSTASGVATTYTAPPPPPSDLTVNITATSVTDTTKSSSATVTVPAITVPVISPLSGIIPINATQQFTATVGNDASNQGLHWTLTQNGTACSPGCGTVSPATTASGAPTTFTGPAAVPANATVTLNAIAAADATKSFNATITLTSGTVKLIPANLTFGCKIGKNCPPPTQAITLTNTGTAALISNSISTTGVFSETNDCPASVVSGASCTVDVTFHPTVAGSYSGAVVFDDSSPDSPQQVALSGTATKFRLANEAKARSDLAGTTSAAVPTPSGPDIVGTRVIDLVDPTREDPYLANGTRRELAIRLWYPASIDAHQNCKPAEYASPAVWNRFAQLVGVRPFPVATNSCLDADVAQGLHPVIMFTPGYTASFTDYTFLMEDLASRGYVAVSVAHTYETTAVQFSDGRLVQSLVGSHLGSAMRRNDRSLSFAVYVRLLDLRFVLNEIEGLNARRNSPFAGKLDMSRIVIAGHSLGGLTALLGSEFDPRLKGAILMDAFVPEALPSATNKPVLILGAGTQQWNATECHLWNNLQGPRLAVHLRGTEHVALSDWIWLTKDAVETGPMGPEKTMAAMRDYIAGFLDANLRGEPTEPFLTGPSPNYPDAEVITQEQLVCGQTATDRSSAVPK